MVFEKYSEKNLLMGLDEPEVEWVDTLVFRGDTSGSTLPDPINVIRMDGTYDCRSICGKFRANGKTRDEARSKFLELMSAS